LVRRAAQPHTKNEITVKKNRGVYEGGDLKGRNSRSGTTIGFLSKTGLCGRGTYLETSGHSKARPRVGSVTFRQRHIVKPQRKNRLPTKRICQQRQQKIAGKEKIN